VRTSPLDAVHRELGAKMVPFGGWEMPVSYPSGTVEEHLACRTAAVVFDVSHLGTVRVEGPGAHALLQAALTNDLDRVGPGRAQYTHLLDPSDASVTDDIIVWWVAPERFDVMPNASNTDGVTGALAEVLAGTGGEVAMADVTAERAILAVQGPTAREVVAKVSPEAAEVGRFRVVEFEWDGHHCVAARTGYTGEDGFEFFPPRERCPELWDALMAEGAADGLRAIGLGARDTLRLEARMPLYGNELADDISPLEAGLAWAVKLDKGDFVGRDKMAAQKAAGVPRKTVGFRMVEKGPSPRSHYEVAVDGRVVGFVTSGAMSPTLGYNLGIAIVEADVAGIGKPLDIMIRGKAVRAEQVKVPFYKRAK